jgi:hypothetical protein
MISPRSVWESVLVATVSRAPRACRWTNRLLVIAAVACALQFSWRETATVARDYWLLRAVGQGLRAGVQGDVYAPAGRHALAAAYIDPAVRRLSRPGIGFDLQARLSDGSMTAEDYAAFDAILVTYSHFGYYGVDTVATPFLFALVDFLGVGSYELDRGVFAVLSIAAFLVGVAIFVHLAGYSGWIGLGVASVAALAWRPYVSDLHVGNVGSIQLALLGFTAGAVSRQKHLTAGVLLGIGLALKPTTALVCASALLLYWIDWRREVVRLAGGVAAGITASVLVCALTFGNLDVWVDWARVVPQLLSSDWSVESGNLSIARVTANAWPAASSLAWLLPLGVGLAVIVRPRPATGHERLDHLYLALATGAALMLLTSGLVWFHYYVLLLPLAIMLLRRRILMAGWHALFRFGTLAAVLSAGTGLATLASDDHHARAVALCVGSLVLCIFAALDLAGVTRPVARATQ